MTIVDDLGSDRYRILCGNNRDHYANVGSVQSVITDPPYGAETHRKERRWRDAEGNIANVAVPFEQLTSHDVTDLTDFGAKNCNGWMLTFCQSEHLKTWQDATDDVKNIRYFRPMYWVKPDAKPNIGGNGPGVGVETIASFWCGEGPQHWNGGGKQGTFHHTRGRREGSRHPTEKPVSLMKELVRFFTNPGDIVFDPFMGSGSTGVAALELGRRFIGIERNSEYYEEAKRRLAEASIPNLILATDAKMPTLFGDTEFPGRRHNERLRKAAKEKADAAPPSSGS